MSHITEAYQAENFRAIAHQLSDVLADYLNQISIPNPTPVLPVSDPDALTEVFDFQAQADKSFPELVELFIQYSNHLHHPRYVGHQVTAPLPVAALAHFTAALLNNGSAVYEMGPANMAMEKQVIREMIRLTGFPEEADGIFTHGGSAGNLTGMLAARQAMASWNIWEEGYQGGRPMVVFVSEQAHYSIERTVRIMGMGGKAVVPIPVDEKYKMRIDILEQEIQKARAEGKIPAAVSANACSTATGTYDDLQAVADLCEKYGLWMHVDAAHGAGALMSEEHRPLLSGIERADSLVIDFHKMFLVTGLNTLVLFRDQERSYETFDQSASYLFEEERKKEWYNGARRTLECTKSAMGFIAYTGLLYFRKEGYKEYIDKVYALAKSFAAEIQKHPSFELAVEPESNIVCFRYVAAEGDTETQNRLNAQIRKDLLAGGHYYIVQTMLGDKLWLRTTLINPLTEFSDLTHLLELIPELI